MGKSNYIGAIDFGQTKTMISVFEVSGNIIAKDFLNTNTNDAEEHITDACKKFIVLYEKLGIAFRDFLGVGSSMPGIVDKDKEILVHAPFAQWHDVPAKRIMKKTLRTDNVEIENDVNASAIGELIFGAAKNHKNFLWVNVATGIGGAVINENRLLEGDNNFAGEIGHMIVEYDNPKPCPCGNYGCLEAHASGTAISKEVQSACERDHTLRVAFANAGLQEDAKACAVMAMNGDKTCIDIFDKAGMYLGRGIAAASCLLDPGAVFIGGGVSESFSLLEKGIKISLNKGVPILMQNQIIEKTGLGYDTALYGSAAIVLQRIAGRQQKG